MHNDLQKNRFALGVTALTLSTVVVKIIGLVYKIPLMHYLGAEGMGYFNSAYELYTLFFVIATAGLPVAVSIMISENLAKGKRENAKKIYRISFALFLIIGFLGALTLFLCAERFADGIGNPRARRCIALIAPTVLFVSVAGAVRGYFQGNQDMTPTAVSQVIEALGKLILGVLLAMWAIRSGRTAEQAAAFAVIGLSAGTALAGFYLLVCYAVRRDRTAASVMARTESVSTILRRLLLLAIPVTISSSLSGLSRIADMTLIMRRLVEAGMESSAAVATYGSYSTMALPVYHLPSSLMIGVAVSLVPTLTAAVKQGDQAQQNDLIGSAFRICAAVCIPCAIGLAAFSRPILELLFAGEADAIQQAEPALAMLGLSVPSACLLLVTVSVLQSHKRVIFPILSMLAGLVVKVVFGYLLVGIPSVSILGAPISTLLCNLVSIGLNLHDIERSRAYTRSVWSELIKPFMAAIASTVAALFVCHLLVSRFSGCASFLLSLPVFGALYLVLAWKWKIFEPQDVALFSKRAKRSNR